MMFIRIKLIYIQFCWQLLCFYLCARKYIGLTGWWIGLKTPYEISVKTNCHVVVQFVSLLLALYVCCVQGGKNKRSSNCMWWNHTFESLCIPWVAFVGFSLNSVNAELEHVCVLRVLTLALRDLHYVIFCYIRVFGSKFGLLDLCSIVFDESTEQLCVYVFYIQYYVVIQYWY